MTLPDLIVRLESATGPSRELDRLIARAVGWHRVEPRHAGRPLGGWIAPEDFCGVMSDGSPKLDSLHGTEIHREPPKFTASLDDALTLVPDGHSWEIDCWPTGRARFHANCGGGALMGLSNAGPAIAMTIAALRARLAMEQQHAAE